MKTPDKCTKAPAGWQCRRVPDHEGPCAAVPVAETCAKCEGSGARYHTCVLQGAPAGALRDDDMDSEHLPNYTCSMGIRHNSTPIRTVPPILSAIRQLAYDAEPLPHAVTREEAMDLVTWIDDRVARSVVEDIIPLTNAESLTERDRQTIAEIDADLIAKATAEAWECPHCGVTKPQAAFSLTFDGCTECEAGSDADLCDASGCSLTRGEHAWGSVIGVDGQEVKTSHEFQKLCGSCGAMAETLPTSTGRNVCFKCAVAGMRP